MKKKLLSLLTALALVAGLSPATLAAGFAVRSDNAEGDNYMRSSSTNGTWTQGVDSYLYLDGEDILRVEFVNTSTVRGKLVVETYDSQFRLRDARQLDMDEAFPYFAGFYAGEKYNFVVSYTLNYDGDASLPAVQFVKYDKSWNRLAHCAVGDLDARTPFLDAAARFAEADGTLYLHSSRQRSDGHDVSLTLALDQETMKATDLSRHAFISHTLNHFIIVDSQGRLVTQDQCDANPARAVILGRIDPEAASATLLEIGSFPGSFGEVATGATIGGLAETSSGYVHVMGDTGLGSAAQPGQCNYNIFLSHTPKDSFSAEATTTRQLTSYTGSASAGTPVLLSTGKDGGYVLWEVQEKDDSRYGYRSTGKLSYVSYSADGSASAVKTVEGQLSDCRPIPYQGGFLWYVTQDSEPTFYHFSKGSLTSHKAQSFGGQDTAGAGSDVKSTDWYAGAVDYVLERGLMDTVNGRFEPLAPADRYTIVEALYRIQDIPGGYPSTFPDVTDDMRPVVDWGYGKGIVQGYSDGTFGPHDPVTREQFSLFLWRYAGLSQVNGHGAEFDTYTRADLSPYSDAGDIGFYAQYSMRWAVYVGLMKGTSGSTLSPQGTITRAEVATMLMRFEQDLLHK